MGASVVNKVGGVSKARKPKRRVISHGDGVFRRQSLALALKPGHANVKFIAADLKPSKHLEVLARLKMNAPKNFRAFDGDSVALLKKTRSNSIDHQYGYYMVDYKRPNNIAFFRQVFRTLKPKKRFVLLAHVASLGRIIEELRSVGFNAKRGKFTEDSRGVFITAIKPE